jgi:hypothetical protein
MPRLIRVCAIAVLLLAMFTVPGAAQTIPFSQRGSVSQSVGFTSISIEYGRPVARGRVLFGTLVPWDSVWHPGADSATRILVDRNITINNQPLRAGAYSLWLIPRQNSAWTVIFSKRDRVFHRPYPGAEHDALRIEVTPAQSSHMETLAIYFPVVLRDEAEMRIHWGTTFLPLSIKAAERAREGTGAGSRPVPCSLLAVTCPRPTANAATRCVARNEDRPRRDASYRRHHLQSRSG